MRRITQHTRALVNDVRGWVDLKLKLTKLEVQEQIDEAMSQAKIGAALAFVAFMAVQFLLTTLALLIGDALGHAKWGFLIITVVLLIIFAGLGYVMQTNPGLLNKTTRKVVVPEKRLKAPPTNGTDDEARS